MHVERGMAYSKSYVVVNPRLFWMFQEDFVGIFESETFGVFKALTILLLASQKAQECHMLLHRMHEWTIPPFRAQNLKEKTKDKCSEQWLLSMLDVLTLKWEGYEGKVICEWNA